MKSATFLLLALAVLSSVPDKSAAAVPRQLLSNRSNLIVGWAGPYDRYLYGEYLYVQAIPNTIQTRDFVYRGSRATNITAVYAYEVGYTQYAQAWIIQGGIRRNNVTVRAQSARGYGFYYQIEVWGQ